ncbi:MAG: hypothetical protein FD177_1122 [Desulfovibrionaceae bacterium]|nr:MAG: hypothetical protein FD177_1122 [Desulfovibrionaceae bacterium]
MPDHAETQMSAADQSSGDLTGARTPFQGAGQPGEKPIRLGVSSCLLGRPVRFDGGHKHDRWITGELGRYVEFVPVCPEVEAGFGVPRESMRLVGDPEAPKLITTKTGRDLTPIMAAWAKKRADELAAENLCGFIFKSKSPSSGMTRVKVYSEKGGMAIHKGVGLFAKAFMERFPLLPVEEEGRLLDARLRENFIERIFVLRSWREVSAACARPGTCTMAAISGFHARHKLLIVAHSPEHARAMGRLVAHATDAESPELHASYEKLLLEALGKLATVPRTVNVLQHICGYFRKLITQDERLELTEVVAAYQRGLTPLIVPVTLINHHVRVQGVAYLAEQVFLKPHPLELKLRNYF